MKKNITKEALERNLRLAAMLADNPGDHVLRIEYQGKEYIEAAEIYDGIKNEMKELSKLMVGKSGIAAMVYCKKSRMRYIPSLGKNYMNLPTVR